MLVHGSPMLRMCNVAGKELLADAAVLMATGALVHLELFSVWEFLAANHTEVVTPSTAVSSGVVVHLQPLFKWKPLAAGATKVIVIHIVVLGKGLSMAAVFAAMTAIVLSSGGLILLDG